MSVTQEDVARRAGVARTTVGYVLSGRRSGGRISPLVCERVRTIAQELGYVPNRRAQALVSGRTRTVGFVIAASKSENWVWSRIAAGAQSTLLERGYDFLMHALSGLEGEEAASLLVREGRVDGAIVIPDRAVRGENPTAPATFPAAWIDLGLEQRRPSVTHDPWVGLGAAVRHLAELGHRAILWVRPAPARPRLTLDRSAAVEHACRECGIGLRTSIIPEESATLFAGYPLRQGAILRVLRQELHADMQETAVMCWNDAIAYCACAVLKERGLQVPWDLSVTGFDDIEPMYHVPPLSTVNAAFYEIGRAAARIVLAQIDRDADGPVPTPESAVCPTRFVERGTTARSRGH